MGMDRLAAMETFVRVADAGSFSAVADQLNVARSAITRQIAALVVADGGSSDGTRACCTGPRGACR